jgi:acylphosphatase
VNSNSSAKLARLYAIVKGYVQGVGFRFETQRAAESLGLVGWVRNRRDRTVEVTAEGNRQALQALADFLKVGPPSADVSDVQVEWSEPTGEFRSFEVRY